MSMYLLLASNYIFILRNETIHIFFRLLINYVIYHSYRQIMNKNTSIMASVIAVAGILTLSVLAHLAFAQVSPVVSADRRYVRLTPCRMSVADPPKQGTGMDGSSHIAIGGGGECMSGGAGGTGGEGGQGGTNFVKHTGKNADIDQDANGGKSNGGYGGNANGGNGSIR
jgi:hypothetical protein